jgi:hypothetical protein
MADEVSKEVQKAIIEQRLQIIRNTIYSFVLDKRVAVKCEDKEMEKNAVDGLKKHERMKDAYEAELAAIDKNTNKA